MKQLEEYREVLEQVEELDEREGLMFMWNLNELLEHALEQAPTEEKQVYAKFYPMLANSDNHEELVNRTEDLYTQFYTHGDSRTEYAEDVVTGLYQGALDRI